MARDLFQESQESLRGATNLYRESQIFCFDGSGCVKINVDKCSQVVINHSFWCFVMSKDELRSTLEAPLNYRHCNFVLILFVHFKSCAKIYLFSSSQSVVALMFSL